MGLKPPKARDAPMSATPAKTRRIFLRTDRNEIKHNSAAETPMK